MTAFLRKFYAGKWYPIAVAGLVFLGHFTGLDVWCGLLLVVFLLPGFWLMDHLRFLIAPVLMASFLVTSRGYDVATSDYHEYLEMPRIGGLIAAGVLFFAGLICFLIHNRKNARPIRPRRLFAGLMAFTVALLCNGLFNPAYTPKNLLFAAIAAASFLLPYFLFTLYGGEGREHADELIYSVAVAGLLIFAELIAAYFTKVRFTDGGIVKESVTTGWGVWTTIGGMLAFLLPSCFYFAHSAKHGWIWYGLGLLLWGGCFLSQSRGALLIGSGILLICLVILCVSGANRKQNRILTAVVVLLALVAVPIFRKQIFAVLENFRAYGLWDNGRFEKWEIGWNHFLEFPVFGSGFYDSYVSEWNAVFIPFLYHNTLVQMLGACGAVGLLAYLFHRTQTVLLIVRRPDPRKTFLGVCILGLLLASLIDVLFFKPYSTLFYGAMLWAMELCSESGSTEKKTA